MLDQKSLHRGMEDHQRHDLTVEHRDDSRSLLGHGDVLEQPVTRQPPCLTSTRTDRVSTTSQLQRSPIY